MSQQANLVTSMVDLNGSRNFANWVRLSYSVVLYGAQMKAYGVLHLRFVPCLAGVTALYLT